MAKEKSASLRPADYSEATGLWEGVGEVTEAAFVMFDYDGKADAPAPTAQLTIQPDEGDAVNQNWSVGKASDWMPSEDGSKLLAIGRATALNVSSNLALLLTSLVNAGYPEDKLSDDITDLVGLRAEFARVPAPKRPGLKPRPGEEAREKTILTVASIERLPWEKKTTAKAGKAAPAKGKAAKAAPAEEEGDDIDAKAQAAVMELLAEHGTLKKNQIPQFLFKNPEVKGDPDFKAILQRVYSDDFLNSGPWTYEGGELS